MWIYLIGGAVVLFFIFKGLRRGANYGQGFYKPIKVIDHKMKTIENAEPNILQPGNEIYYEEGTGKPYLKRQMNFMERGNPNIWLENYEKEEMPAVTLYYNNANVRENTSARKLANAETLLLENENLLAEKTARIVELENKIEEILGKRVEFAEKQNVASRKGIPQKPQNKGSGGAY